MSDVVLLWPAYWPWLLLLPLAVLPWRWHERRVERQHRALLGARAEVLLGRPVHRRRRALLLALALSCFAVVLLQPVRPGPSAVLGADVVLCVDVSRSMAARDVSPSRAGVAIAAINELAQHAPGSRLALVAFAGTAERIAPLTHDGPAIAELAQQLQPGLLTGGGTDPGAALTVAGALLRTSPGASIVLLGDGEDFVGNGAAAAEALVAAGHRVHTLGIGTEAGSKIVVDGPNGETFFRDASGQEVVTHCELASLQAIAAAGQGRAGQLVLGDELVRLHDDVLVPAARTAALRAGTLEPVPCFQLPLCLGLLFWMLRRAVPTFRR